MILNDNIPTEISNISFENISQPEKEYIQKIKFSDNIKINNFLQNPNYNLEDEKVQEVSHINKNGIFNMIQDPRISAFSHKKLEMIEMLIFLLTVVSFYINFLNTEITTSNIIKNSLLNMMMLNLESASTFFLVGLILIRYSCLFQLHKDQHKIYKSKVQQNYKISLINYFKKSQDAHWCILEVCIILPHPNYLCMNLSFQIFQPMDEVYITHQCNDLLAIFMLLRIYLLFRALISLTIYSSPRASRLCQQNRVQHNFLYSSKCILNEHPLWAILIVFVISLVMLGNGLKLSQRAYVLTSSLHSSSFKDYQNCIWAIFISMGTIGYNDYSPKTIPGRLIIVIAAIIGVLLGSLLIVALTNYLTMQNHQLKSHLSLLRLQQQRQLSQQASKVLKQTIKVTQYLSQIQDQNQKNILKALFVKLKKKIDSVKLRNRKIKSMTDNSNMIQQMNRLFQLISDSLEQALKNHKIISKYLNSIEATLHKKTQTRKISLVTQVQKAIKQL